MLQDDIKGSQIRAALALLDWARADLAKASGVSVPTTARLQAGAEISRQNRAKIVDALTRAGVRFVRGGVILAVQEQSPGGPSEFHVEIDPGIGNASPTMQEKLAPVTLERPAFLALAGVSSTRLDMLRHRDQLPFADDGAGYTFRRAVEVRLMLALAEEGLSLRDSASMVARAGPQVGAAIGRHDAPRSDGDLWLAVLRLVGPDTASGDRDLEIREPIVATLRDFADKGTRAGLSVSELESGKFSASIAGFAAVNLSSAIRAVLRAATAAGIAQ